MVNGLCDQGKRPHANGAPMSGNGRLIIVVDNMPQVSFDATGGTLTSPDTRVWLDFGGSSVLSRVSYSTTRRSEFEFTLSQLAAPVSGTYQLMVKTSASPVTFSARFPFSFYDESIALQCTPGTCAARATGAPALTASITNVLVVGAATDALSVTFGSRAAESFSVVSTNSSLTILSIVPPAFNCASCVYTAGAAATTLSVFSKTDPALGATTPFTFWAPPQIVSAAFDAVGAQILVRFDQATNRANMQPSDSACGLIFSNNTLEPLGDSGGLKCVWQTSQVLAITLGKRASVAPGQVLSVGGTRALRSLNEVSQRSASTITVASPDVPAQPDITLSGTSVLDRCTDVDIEVISSGPRPLAYTWFSDNANVQRQLLGYTGSQPVIDITDFDVEIAISVYGVDFLKQSSKTQTIRVTKLSSAVPSLSFFPPSSNVFNNEATVVTAIAQFSSCKMAKSDLIFSWRQVLSDDSSQEVLPQEVLSSTTSQLVIPAGTLTAGATYTVAAKLTMSDDPSKQSESMHSIIVGTRDLVPTIAGGSAMEASALKALVLDASASYDPDDMAGNGQELDYAWSCSLLVSGVAYACKDTSMSELVFEDSSTITIPPETLAPTAESPYMFQVTVSKAGKMPRSFSMPVTMSKNRIPTVSVSSSVGLALPDGSVLVNSNDRVVLSGACDESEGILQWSFSPAVSEDASAFPLGLSSSSLVVYGDPLSPFLPGNTYNVELSCTNADNLAGRAQKSLIINAVPSGLGCSACRVSTSGQCEKTGQAILDKFRFTCESFADQHIPLWYRFGYREPGASQVTWLGASKQRSLVMGFPSGEVTLYAQVEDNLGAQSAVYTDTITLQVDAVNSGERRQASLQIDADDLGGRRQASLTPTGSAQLDKVKVLIQEALLRNDAREANKLVGTATVEARNSPGGLFGPLTPEMHADFATFSLQSLRSAVDKFAIDSTYACETLGAVQLSAATTGNLVSESVQEASSLVRKLVSADVVLDSDCATQAFMILGNLFTAHTSLYARSELDASISQTFLQVCMYVYTHVCMYVRLILASVTSSNLYVHVCMYVCMYVRLILHPEGPSSMYTCVCRYMYVEFILSISISQNVRQKCMHACMYLCM